MLLLMLLGLAITLGLKAQTYTNLHLFAGYPDDGANPQGGLTLSGINLYGTAEFDGSSSNGTVFAINTDGTGFTNLYNFTTTSGALSTNSDGARSRAGLILSDNILYGTTYEGGNSGNGTVFAVNTDGTDFTNLHSFTEKWENFLGYFTNSDGANPLAGLILSGNTLYGTAEYGGTSGNGAVFAINTDGTGFTNLYSFTATNATSGLYPVYTNSDGANPQAGLVLSGNILYGTTYDGGSSGNGTVFAINTDGTGFTNLYSFTALVSNTNSDGANPHCSLTLSGNTLYGTAQYGGSSGNGTCSPSTPAARILRTCIVSRQRLVFFLPTATELTRRPD